MKFLNDFRVLIVVLAVLLLHAHIGHDVDPIHASEDDEKGENADKRPKRKESNAQQSTVSQDSDEYWNWSPTPKKTTIIEREVSDISSQITLPSSGHKDDKQSMNASSFNSALTNGCRSSALTSDPNIN